MLMAPAAAQAGWLPAVDLSAKSESALNPEPQIAVDGSGGALAVWPQLNLSSVIQASTKTAGGAWGPSVNIGPANSVTPRVAMNAAGDAVAIWIRYGSQLTIEATTRTPDGSWAPRKTLGIAGYPGDLDVAIDPIGHATAVWTRMTDASDYVIEGSSKSPDGAWEPPVAISEGGSNSWDPKVAVDATGRAVAVWYRFDDSGDAVVQAAEKRVGQAWSEAEDLTDGSADAVFPQVAVSTERAVVLWQQDEVVEGAIKAAGGAWEEPMEISAPNSAVPHLAMDPAGNAIAIWVHEPVEGLTAETAALPVGGDWSEPVTVADRLAGAAAPPEVAVDPAGRAMATWTAWTGATSAVEAASGTVAGNWNEPVTISPPGKWASAPQVAMDSGGNAAAVWRGETVQAAVFDVTRPELRSVSIPAVARAGRPVAFAASPFDAWSLVNQVSWTFGDGSTATGASAAHAFKETGRFQVTVTATDAAGHSTTASGEIEITPALAVSARLVRVRRGRARLELHCPGVAVCEGNASLMRRVAKRKGSKRSPVIGRFNFSIPGNTRRTVSTKLKPKVLQLLRAAGKRGIRTHLRGNAVEARTVVLKPVPPKRKPRR
jgi:hypothetical protein